MCCDSVWLPDSCSHGRAAQGLYWVVTAEGVSRGCVKIGNMAWTIWLSIDQ